jgi:hypothetical protein
LILVWKILFGIVCKQVKKKEKKEVYLGCWRPRGPLGRPASPDSVMLGRMAEARLPSSLRRVGPAQNQSRTPHLSFSR